jgi:hypothetical protein
VVAQAWTDDDFKVRLLADPKAVLTENGISLPDDLELRVVENTDSLFYVALPPPPEGDLSEEDLATVAGGGSTVGTAGSAGTFSTASCPACIGSFGCAGTAGTAG